MSHLTAHILLRFPMFNTITKQFVQQERKLPPRLNRKNLVQPIEIKLRVDVE